MIYNHKLLTKPLLLGSFVNITYKIRTSTLATVLYHSAHIKTPLLLNSV